MPQWIKKQDTTEMPVIPPYLSADFTFGEDPEFDSKNKYSVSVYIRDQDEPWWWWASHVREEGGKWPSPSAGFKTAEAAMRYIEEEATKQYIHDNPAASTGWATELRQSVHDIPIGLRKEFGLKYSKPTGDSLAKEMSEAIENRNREIKETVGTSDHISIHSGGLSNMVRSLRT